MPLFVTLVLDGVGIGAQPDAKLYGEDFCDTLGHVVRAVRPALPHLEKLGLGCIRPLDGLRCVPDPRAAYGRMQEVSAGMDSTTGHWELAGIPLERPFPTYPGGFPAALLERFREAAGIDGVLDGGVASGTEVIARLGAEHTRAGFPIVYTSADSVFQVAAHTGTVGLEALYRMCALARERVCVGTHAVGRVIARPFEGEEGAYRRLSEKRKDFALEPPSTPVQEALRQHGVRTVAVGKIGDLFASVGFDEVHKTESNEEGITQTLERMRRYGADAKPTFIWTNLVDFDQEYGHRNDAPGFAGALERFDRRLPDFLDALPSDAILVLTADHGNDPTTPSTDHNREFVPLLVCGVAPRELGLRPTFADHAASVAAYFGVPFETAGTSFLHDGEGSTGGALL